MAVSRRIMALAAAMHTAPCKIADVFGANPFFAERLLHSRGQRCLDGETLLDCIARHYGDAVAREFNECISVDAWEDAK